MKSIEALYKLNRMTLKEEDIPDIDYDLEVDSNLDGPDRGIETGVAGLLLDQIAKVAQNINDYNMMRANLEDYPEIDELIKDLADQENENLGKLQSALKSISPNAELIMNGAVEAEADFPLDEKLLNEKTAILDDNDKEFYATYFVGEALEKSNTFKPIEDVVVNQYQNIVKFTIEDDRFSANINIVKE